MTVITNNGKRVWGLLRPTTWRKIIAGYAIAVCTIMWSAPPCFAQRSDVFTYAIGSMKHSVAVVTCPKMTSPNSYQPISVGTAFFITHKGDFVTPDHVLQAFADGKEFAGCPSEIAFNTLTTPGRFENTLFAFKISDCVRDTGIDIARCHTTDDISTAQGGKYEREPVTIDPDIRDDGSAIAFIGFPLGNSFPISARGYIGGYQTDERGPVQMVVDRAAWPGASGSPVFDYKGHVVGMMVKAGENFAAGISYARTGYAISQFLSAHPLSAK